ncbi:MAG: hypothetical protein ACD_72C00289G0006 [uncultured bacterium]|nr:MAG: hypothetical protein ACD_72C00289G0006 [uncultured bacterium]
MSDDVLKEVELIKERNKKVELDKAWETSWTRRLSIAFGTYIVAVLWLMMINENLPWLKAFLPAVGYILSTLSLPMIKRWWGRGKM